MVLVGIDVGYTGKYISATAEIYLIEKEIVASTVQYDLLRN